MSRNVLEQAQNVSHLFPYYARSRPPVLWLYWNHADTTAKCFHQHRRFITVNKIRKERRADSPEVSFGGGLSRSAEILTLKKMKYFLAVADTGQITAAAHEIHVSPAVITTAIRQMEDFLSVKLFERDRRGMRLTIDGARFRNYCEKTLSLVKDAVWALKKTSHLTGELTLAASPAVHGYFLPPLLSRFRRLFPMVHVSLLELCREEIEERIIDDRLDAGIVLISNVKKRSRLNVLTLLSSRRTLWCNANHRFSEMKAVSLAEVAREPYIQLTIDEAEENTRMFFAEHGKKPQCHLHTETVEAVRGYVAQGEGVTILSEILFRPWSLEGDRILSKPVVEDVPRMKIGFIGKAGRRHSPAQTALRDFLAFYKRDFSVLYLEKAKT